MTSYKQFIIESNDVVSHLEHIEDYVLNGGVTGTRKAILYLRDLRDALAGHSKGKVNATIKYDGAPSLFAGIDPTDGKFFVAKKSIFNKNPKVYKTVAEVDADTSGDLADKLNAALKYLPAIGIKGIIQGDFMFSRHELKMQTIAGEEFLTFHPNTIVYAVPANSVLANEMLGSKIGIVWHTKYTGKDFASLKAESGGAIAKTLKKSPNVWFDDASIRDLSGTVSMTQVETDEVTKILSDLGAELQRATTSALNEISANELLIMMKTYNNSKIRVGETHSDPTAHVRGLVSWMTDKFQKERDAKKNEQSKLTIDHRRRVVMSYFSRHSVEEVAHIFHMMNLIVLVKNILNQKLNRLDGMHTFLKTKNGYQVTGQEGYVITDHIGKNAVKLVDRLEFSRANFSKDYIKGYEH